MDGTVLALFSIKFKHTAANLLIILFSEKGFMHFFAVTIKMDTIMDMKRDTRNLQKYPKALQDRVFILFNGFTNFWLILFNGLNKMAFFLLTAIKNTALRHLSQRGVSVLCG